MSYSVSNLINMITRDGKQAGVHCEYIHKHHEGVYGYGFEFKIGSRTRYLPVPWACITDEKRYEAITEIILEELAEVDDTCYFFRHPWLMGEILAKNSPYISEASCPIKKFSPFNWAEYRRKDTHEVAEMQVNGSNLYMKSDDEWMEIPFDSPREALYEMVWGIISMFHNGLIDTLSFEWRDEAPAISPEFIPQEAE